MYHAVYETFETCFQCGLSVVRLEPPLQGWTYYCAACQAMVTTRADFERAANEPAEPGQIGRVVAWPLSEPLRWA
jgi:hypothetical protein